MAQTFTVTNECTDSQFRFIDDVVKFGPQSLRQRLLDGQVEVVLIIGADAVKRVVYLHELLGIREIKSIESGGPTLTTLLAASALI